MVREEQAAHPLFREVTDEPEMSAESDQRSQGDAALLLERRRCEIPLRDLQQIQELDELGVRRLAPFDFGPQFQLPRNV